MSDDKHCNIFIDFFSLEIIQLGIFFRQVLRKRFRIERLARD